MTMLRDGFAELMLPGLSLVISDKFKMAPEQYSKIFNVKKSTQRYEYGLTVEGFGAAVEQDESNPVQFVDLTQGYKKTYTNLRFSRGTRVSRDAYDDDLYKIFKEKLGAYLARSIKQRFEILAADVLNNGFSVTGADGKYLFATDHPYKSGGTYANALATGADLSATSLQDLITVAETTTDAGSVPIELVMKQLIIAPANKWVAKELLKSEKDPETANNAYNAIKDENLSLIILRNLSDSGSWFLAADKDMHDLTFWKREAPKVSAEDDFDSGDAKIKITARAVAGYTDPRGICGTTQQCLIASCWFWLYQNQQIMGQQGFNSLGDRGVQGERSS